jgi:hypothetical protein
MNEQSQDQIELSKRHAQHMEAMSDMEVLEYLLDCQGFIEARDLDGWTKKYNPIQKQPVKRRRMSPGAYIWTPYPNCIGCGSGEIIEDVKEANVVCTMCGIIQSVLIGTQPVLINADRLAEVSPVVVHRYSRIVYFRSFMLSMVGMTEPEISVEVLDRLRLAIVGAVSKKSVLLGLKSIGLLTRYRRHAVSIAGTLDRTFKPLVIPGAVFLELLKLFRRVEYFWENDGHKKQFKGRSVFLSYPYVYYQLCVHMDQKQLTGKHHLLKSRPLLGKLHASYGALCIVAKLSCDLSIFND